LAIGATAPLGRLDTRLECAESAPAAARDAVRALDPADPLLGDAMLLASELVTNALQHSGWRPGDRFALRVELWPDHLRIEVADPGRAATSPTAAAPENAFGSMGLRIVEALATRWGASRQAGELVVWAELDRS
jgi:anti-sigma regulatory factor (Ser/Thr protein kinase)